MYIADKSGTKYCIDVFCTHFSIALEDCKPLNLVFKWFPESKFITEMFCFLSEHTLIIYKRFQEKKNVIALREIIWDQFKPFRFRHNFKRFENSKWVWSGNTTITNRRQPHGTARKSHTTITRHQEDKFSKATSSLFSIKMVAILEWT